MKFVVEISEKKIDAALTSLFINKEMSEKDYKTLQDNLNKFMESEKVIDEKYFREEGGLKLEITAAYLVIGAAIIKMK